MTVERGTRASPAGSRSTTRHPADATVVRAGRARCRCHWRRARWSPCATRSSAPAAVGPLGPRDRRGRRRRRVVRRPGQRARGRRDRRRRPPRSRPAGVAPAHVTGVFTRLQAPQRARGRARGVGRDDRGPAVRASPRAMRAAAPPGRSRWPRQPPRRAATATSGRPAPVARSRSSASRRASSSASAPPPAPDRPAAEARSESCELLNEILADTTILYALYKKAHWNAAGPTFYQLHLLFDKHAEEQGELIDEIAERVQMLGGISVGDPRHAAELTTIERAARRRGGDPGRPRPAARGARDDHREGPRGHRDDRGVEGLGLQRPADGRRPAAPRDAGLVPRRARRRRPARRRVAARPDARGRRALPGFREPAATTRRRTTSATCRRSLHRPATGSRSKECSTRVSCCPCGWPPRPQSPSPPSSPPRASRRPAPPTRAPRRAPPRPRRGRDPRRLGGRVRPAGVNLSRLPLVLVTADGRVITEARSRRSTRARWCPTSRSGR